MGGRPPWAGWRRRASASPSARCKSRGGWSAVWRAAGRRGLSVDGDGCDGDVNRLPADGPALDAGRVDAAALGVAPDASDALAGASLDAPQLLDACSFIRCPPWD